MLTTLLPVPLAPEISLHLAGSDVGLFDQAGGEFRSDQPLPFWAFVWAGGQALARYVLDHPETVLNKTVIDLATGSGVAAIAAAKARAAQVGITDINPEAIAAAHRNAAANRVTLSDDVGDPDVILAGDVFYSPTVAEQMIKRLRAERRKDRQVLVGDPGRGYFPERLFEPLAEYTVPVPAALEETEALATTVWRMR
ncbi:class I SAM-dependent methyltransferase [Actinoplanes sp. NPDC051513]|uniref:class I SAM-dependent methyltransferase n=1 Tax=Actinoplanes sp. NPDC051513 TaxID=3363908 RepID=UPI00379E9A74